MTFAVFSTIALVLLVVAFVHKGTTTGMLRIVSTIAWMIMIPLSFLQGWPAGNTFLPVAAAFFCSAIMLISLVATIMFYVDWSRSRRADESTYDEQKTTDKERIYKLTHKKRNLWD